MAAGTVVVATETEGAKEVIEDRQTGILVPIGDVPKMAAAVTSVLGDYNRREMGARAREVAVTRFSLDRMVTEIEKIYAAAERG
jgi:glycosyltransferase involved in cell wall biosynthesis